MIEYIDMIELKEVSKFVLKNDFRFLFFTERVPFMVPFMTKSPNHSL